MASCGDGDQDRGNAIDSIFRRPHWQQHPRRVVDYFSLYRVCFLKGNIPKATGFPRPTIDVDVRLLDLPEQKTLNRWLKWEKVINYREQRGIGGRDGIGMQRYGEPEGDFR